MFGLKVDGLDQVNKRLGTLEPKMRKKLLKTSLRKGADITLAAAKTNVPVRKGTIKKALMVRAARGLKRGQVGVVVGFRASKKLISVTKRGERYFIPAAVEYGHAAPHATEAKIDEAAKRSHKAGFSAKAVGPHPFMRPAYDSTKDRARSAIIEDVKTEIDALNRG